METEIQILKTDLSNIFSPVIINLVCRLGYSKTGDKFNIGFRGSKGYLDGIVISCEGNQKADNSIFGIFNKDGSIKKKTLNVFHSKTNGVRLSLGNDAPNMIETEQCLKNCGNTEACNGLCLSCGSSIK